MQITLTLTVEQLMSMPGEAVIRIIDQAKPPAEFLTACQAYENRTATGKGRWVVNNHIRQFLRNPPSNI